MLRALKIRKKSWHIHGGSYCNGMGNDNEGQSCALSGFRRPGLETIGDEELLEHERLECQNIHRRASLA